MADVENEEMIDLSDNILRKSLTTPSTAFSSLLSDIPTLAFIPDSSNAQIFSANSTKTIMISPKNLEDLAIKGCVTGISVEEIQYIFGKKDLKLTQQYYRDPKQNDMKSLQPSVSEIAYDAHFPKIKAELFTSQDIKMPLNSPSSATSDGVIPIQFITNK